MEGSGVTKKICKVKKSTMCGSYRDPLYCTVDDVISNWSHFTAVMHEPNDTIKLTKTISFKLKEKIKFR
jgi:hypothetical protein